VKSKYNGQKEFLNCPADLWKLFVTQTHLENKFGPGGNSGYAEAGLSAAAGVAPDVPDYSEAFTTKLGEVINQAGDVKDVIDLVKGGFQPADLSAMGAGIVVKAISASVEYLAKKSLETTLINNNVRGVFFDPAIDVAKCVVDPTIKKELNILNWPYGNDIEITIKCPVCDHITIQLEAIKTSNAKEYAAIKDSAIDITKIGTAVKADASRFTDKAPWKESKAAKAIVTFLRAIGWLNSDRKATLNTAELTADAAAGANFVAPAFVQLRERVQRIRRALQP